MCICWTSQTWWPVEDGVRPVDTKYAVAQRWNGTTTRIQPCRGLGNLTSAEMLYHTQENQPRQTYTWHRAASNGEVALGLPCNINSNGTVRSDPGKPSRGRVDVGQPLTEQPSDDIDVRPNDWKTPPALLAVFAGFPQQDGGSHGLSLVV